MKGLIRLPNVGEIDFAVAALIAIGMATATVIGLLGNVSLV